MSLAGDPRGQEAVLAAQRALRMGDVQGARNLLQKAATDNPKDISVQLHLALALRQLGDARGALAALNAALEVDPYFFVALLSKGTLLEQTGHHKKAAETFRLAVAAAPPPEETPPEMRGLLEHAQQIVRDNAARLEAYLHTQLDPLRTRHHGEKLDRFDECLQVMAGTKKIYTQKPQLLNFPHLPAIQFFDNGEFPWMDKLAAATEAIREELLMVLRDDIKEFQPYIAYPPGTPLNQWAELNHSPLWTSFFLWRDGARVDAHCKRCPRTTALLESLPLADQPGFAPTAMFSHLQPRTRIPPHTGSTNVRLVVHLPLILPGKCGFRVGNDTREWKMDQGWVFDDTIEHEAWNDSDQTRTILIFDVWNPYLSAAERELVRALLTATKNYYKDD